MECTYSTTKNRVHCKLFFEVEEGKVSKIYKCEVSISYGNTITFSADGNILEIDANSSMYIVESQMEDITTTVREVIEEFKVKNLL